MLSKIRWPHLTAIAGGAGIGIGVMMLLLNKERESYANRASFVQSAVAKLRNQPAALSLLGDSFEVGRASLQDGWGKMDTTNVRIRVPIYGKTDNASLYVYARKKKEEKARYKLFKIEMTFDKVKGKKLILMDLGDATEAEDDSGPVQPEEKAKPEDIAEERKRARIEEIRRNQMKQLQNRPRDSTSP